MIIVYAMGIANQATDVAKYRIQFVLLYPNTYAPLAVVPEAQWLGEVSTRLSSLSRTMQWFYRPPMRNFPSHLDTTISATALLRSSSDPKTSNLLVMSANSNLLRLSL